MRDEAVMSYGSVSVRRPLDPGYFERPHNFDVWTPSEPGATPRGVIRLADTTLTFHSADAAIQIAAALVEMARLMTDGEVSEPAAQADGEVAA